MSRTFKREELVALLDGESEVLKKVSDTITSKSRWSLNHELVFQENSTGRFFRTYYSEGSTEQQDEKPFEYAPEDVEVVAVQPVERTVTVYETIP